jgi:hypothetical protein
MIAFVIGLIWFLTGSELFKTQAGDSQRKACQFIDDSAYIFIRWRIQMESLTEMFL